MRTFCERCDKFVDATVKEAVLEQVVVRGKQVSAQQRHALCPVCGDEVFPNALINFNVTHAHDAYRKAVGSITSGEIRSLLEKYDIGAQPMSRLLGWGDNSIERQIKHTVPDREHTRRLYELLNSPQKMRELLLSDGGRIAETALHKAMAAVDALISSEAQNGISFVLNHHWQTYYFPRLNQQPEMSAMRGEYSCDYKSRNMLSSILAALFAR